MPPLALLRLRRNPRQGEGVRQCEGGGGVESNIIKEGLGIYLKEYTERTQRNSTVTPYRRSADRGPIEA